MKRRVSVRNKFPGPEGRVRRGEPVQHAFYEPIAKARGLRVRAVAIGDWFKAPKVEAIDASAYSGRSGDVIGICATDDVGVVGVTVTNWRAKDDAIEQGAAVFDGSMWHYTATTTLEAAPQVVIEARAIDRPGNTAIRNQTWPMSTLEM